MPENELYHHGITGMRWGFRRFQNEDGSLTPEGELRYNQGKQKLARGKAAEMYKTKKYKAKLALKAEKQKIKDTASAAKTAKKEQAKLNAEDRVIRKKPQNMTDEELKNEVNRLAMEIDYQKKSWQVEKGKKGPGTIDKLDEFFERPTGRIVAQLGGNIIQQVATQSLNKIIEEKTSTLKKQQIANAKKMGEKTQAEIDRTNQTAANEKKEFDAKYNETYGKKPNSNKKSDYTADRAAWEKKNYTNTTSNTSSNSSTKDTKGSKSDYTADRAAWEKKNYTNTTSNTSSNSSTKDTKGTVKPKTTTYSMKEGTGPLTLYSSKYNSVVKFSTKDVGSIPTTKTEYDLYGQVVNAVQNDPISVVINDENIKKIFK